MGIQRVGVCLMTRKFANSSGVDIKIQGSVVRKANKAIHSLSSERYPLDSAYPASRVASIFLDTSGLLPMMYVNSRLSGNCPFARIPEKYSWAEFVNTK